MRLTKETCKIPDFSQGIEMMPVSWSNVVNVCLDGYAVEPNLLRNNKSQQLDMPELFAEACHQVLDSLDTDGARVSLDKTRRSPFKGEMGSLIPSMVDSIASSVRSYAATNGNPADLRNWHPNNVILLRWYENSNLVCRVGDVGLLGAVYCNVDSETRFMNSTQHHLVPGNSLELVAGYKMDEDGRNKLHRGCDMSGRRAKEIVKIPVALSGCMMIATHREAPVPSSSLAHRLGRFIFSTRVIHRY